MTSESDHHGRWDEPAAGGPSSDPAADAEARDAEPRDAEQPANPLELPAAPSNETDTSTDTSTDDTRSTDATPGPERDEAPMMDTQTDPNGAGAGTPPAGPESGQPGNGDPGNGNPGAPGAEFFDRIRSFGLVRPADGGWLAGVCAAAARRWNVDPILARGIAVVLLILGPGILIYGLAWAFLPAEDGRIHAQQVLTGDVSAGFVGAALLVVGWLINPSMRFGHDGFGWGGPAIVVVALIGFAIWWYVRKQEGKPLWDPGAGHTPGARSGAWYGPGQQPSEGTGSTTSGTTSTTTSPTTATTDWKAVSKRIEASAGQWGEEVGAASKRMGDAAGAWADGVTRSWQEQQDAKRRSDPARPSRAISRIFVGLALLGGALAVVLDRTIDLPGSTWLLGLSAALVMVAVGIIAAGVLGRRPGGLAPLGVLLALGLLASFAVGDRTWRPADATAARQDYQLVAGEAVLDLGRLPSTGANLEATVGLGDLTVKVPAGTDVEIRTGIGAGSLRVGESRADLRNIRRAGDQHRAVLVVGDPQRASENVVEAQVGLGDLTVLAGDVKVGDQ